MWYRGDGGRVPLFAATALGAWIGDRLVTLADLEDTTVGGRQPPGGESILVRGRAAGVVLEAEFFAGDTAAMPLASVSLTIYPGGCASSRPPTHFRATATSPHW